MQIVLPDILTFNNISSIQVIGLDKNQKINFKYNSALINNSLPIISIHNKLWKNTVKVLCRIVNNNKEIEYDISNLNILKKVKAINPVSEYLKQNIDTLYLNKDSDKKTIDNILNYNINLINKENELIERKTKNLIYFTLSAIDDNYIELLINSINSLINNNLDKNFDILLITDNITKNKIQKLPILNKINDYFIMDDAKDGIESSLWKTNIFEYKLISNYNNVLYLDADTICKKSIVDLLNNTLNENILYTLSNKDIPFNSYRTFYHGLQFYTDEKLQQMFEKQQFPFNAGQFLFKSCDKMKNHFRNLRWLINNWPGQYFFEQSFMNHYFCGNFLTDSSLLPKFIELINVKTSDFSNQHNDFSSILHFIGPALKGSSKINFIKKYINANKL